MAYNNQKRTIDYEIQFKTNQQSLRNVAAAFQKMTQNLKFSELQIINKSSIDQARTDLLTIQKTANQVEDALTAAFNPKLGITNIEAFKNNLSQAGLSIQQVRKDFELAGGAGTAAFQSMANSLTNVRLKATESASIIDKMGEGLKRSLGWTAASTVINKFTGSIQEAYGYVKHLDTSLNDIRIVTEYSADAMDKFAEKANKAAISLGKSTTDYTEAALIYYQQGLGEEDVAARTNVTLKTANVTQQSTAQVSEELTAIWNGYKVNAEEAELYIDKVAKVAATTAADLEEMATGMSKVASAANVMGVDIDQMNAILATTISVTRQAPESVGAAYKTIFARMSSIQAGEETEDGATLASYTEKMAAMGVSVLDTNGKLRDMGDIIEEVGEKWSDWGREQQIAFAQVAAGTRQYNNLIALFDNWDMYKQSLEDSRNAMGTLQTQQDIYMESTAAHLQQLRTAAEGVYDSLLNSEDINTAVDGLTEIVKNIEPVVEGLGGIKGMLLTISPLMINAFSSNVGTVLSQAFANFTVKQENIAMLQQLDDAIKAIGKDAPVTTQNYTQLKKLLLNMGTTIDPETFNKISKSIENQAVASAELEKVNSELLVVEQKIQENNDKIIVSEQELTTQRKAAVQATNDRIEAEKRLQGIQKSQNLTTKSLWEDAENVIPTPIVNGKPDSSMVEDAQKEYIVNSLKQKYGFSQGELNSAGVDATSQRNDLEQAINKLLQQRIQIYNVLLQNAEKDVKQAKEKEKTQQNILRGQTTENQKLSEAEKLEERKNKLLEEQKQREREINQLKSNNIQLQKQAINQLGQSLTQIASGLLSLQNVYAQIQNLMKTLSDDSLDAGERIKEVIAQTSSLVMSGAMAFSTLTSGVSKASSAIGSFVVAQTTSNAAVFSGKVAVNALTGAELTLAAAATAAQVAVGAIIAGAIIYGIYKVVKAIQSVTSASEDATKALNKQKNALKEARQHYNDISEQLSNFTNSFEKLDEEKKVFETLTSGTEEWKEELQKVREITDDLLEKYPELITYATYEDGGWVISEEGLKSYQEKLQNQQAFLNGQILQGGYNTQQGQLNVSKANLQDSITNDTVAYDTATKVSDTFLSFITGHKIDRSIYNHLDKEGAQSKLERDLSLTQEELKNLVQVYKDINDIDTANYYKQILDLQIQQTELSKKNEEIQQNILRAQLDSKIGIGLQGKEDIIKDDDKEYINSLISDFVLEQSNSNEALNQAIKAANQPQGQGQVLPYLDTLLSEIYGEEWTNRDKKYDANGGLASDSISIKDENGEIKTLVTFDNWESFKQQLFVYTTDINETINSVLQNKDRTIENLKRAVNQGYSIDKLTPKEASQVLGASQKEEYQQNREQAKTIVSQSKAGTELLQELTGKNGQFVNITNKEYKQLAEKIENIISTSGKAGLEEFSEYIKDKPFKAAIEFNKEQAIDDLQQKLDDAKIDISTFNTEKEARKNENLSDDAIINYIKAQKDLNDIYEKRKEFFDSFGENFDIANATRDQITNIEKLKTTLETLTGEDLDFDFISKHLKIIEGYINGDEEATWQWKAALVSFREEANKLNVEEKLKSVGELFNDTNIGYGESLNKNRQKEIDTILEGLNFSQAQIAQIYIDSGYVWDKDSESWVYNVRESFASEAKIDTDYEAYKETVEEFLEGTEALGKEEWEKAHYTKDTTKGFFGVHWVKNTEAIDYLKYQSKIDKHENVNLIKEETLLSRYGGITGEDLERFGWERHDEGPTPFWIKTSKGLDIWQIQQIIETEAPEIKEGSSTVKELLTFTPRLDTSVIDRQLDELNLKLKRLQDAQKDLNGEALISNLQQQIDLEDQILEKKKEKIEKEKQYRSDLTDSLKFKGNGGQQALGFEYDNEGRITNRDNIEKAYLNKINDEKDKTEKGNLTTDEANILKYIDEYNSSVNNTTKFTEEEYEHLKKIRDIEEEIANAAAERTNATKSQLSSLDHEAESLSKALEALGDASDYTGQTLIDYNKSYSDLLQKQTENAEARKQVLAEEQNRLAKDSQDYLSDIGINLDDYKLEDGTYDIDAMAAKVDEMTAANKDNVQELERINHIWKEAKYGIENYNKDVIEQNTLWETILKNRIETARINETSKFAEVNKQLDDINKKVDRYQDKMNNSKSLADKAGSVNKLSAQADYFADIDKYINETEKYNDIFQSKLETAFGKDGSLAKYAEIGNGSILKLFNSETEEEFMSNYDNFIEDMDKVKDQIDTDILELTKKKEAIYTDDKYKNWTDEQKAEEAAKYQVQIDALKVNWEQVAGAEEQANKQLGIYISRQPDLKAVEDLGKEWKSAAVDREIKKVNRELSLLQKQQSRLKGKDVITNLQQQVTIIQKHIKLEQKKLELMKSELKVQKSLIQRTINQMELAALGSAFDADGHISSSFMDNLAKSTDVANEKLQVLLGYLKEYESMMKEIESQEDTIVGLQDEISDKNYEMAQKIKEETRKATEKALNQFKITLEVALDAAEAFRKLDRLQAKIDRLRDTDWFNQAVLDYNDAISYATNDVTLLTDAVNKLIGDYNSGAWKDMYDTQKDARDDIMGYANQLMDAVQSYYDAIDSAKEKYASAIDSIISANQDLINDFERIKKYANQGISILQLLPGGGSYDELNHYYNQINKANEKEVDYLLQQKDYYKALLSTLDPLNQPELYKSVKSAYDSVSEEALSKTAESIQGYKDQMKALIEKTARDAKEEIAKLSGYASTISQQIAHDRQDQILKDYYDTYESEYEIASLANKYSKAISETDNLAHKKELTKVMQEQLKLLKEQAGEEKRLTKYEVDRANAVYELTLRQMALDEAKANKSQMRLRRDTQGNYRYEYVGDEAQTTDATQAVLDAQYKIYELDKNRLVELTKAKEKLLDDYTTRLNEILDNQYMTTEQKEAAVEELRAWYLEQSQQLYENYAEAVTNINESSAGNLDDVLKSMIDEVGQTADEAKEHFGTIDEKIVSLADDMNLKLEELERLTGEVMEKIGGSIESVQDPIDAQIGAVNELIDVDLQLINEWENQVVSMQSMLEMLQALEYQYRALMEAALAAADAAARLQVTDFSTADERDSEMTSETTTTSSSASGTSGGGTNAGETPHGSVPYFKAFDVDQQEYYAGPPEGITFNQYEQKAVAAEPDITGRAYSSWQEFWKRVNSKPNTAVTFGTAKYDTGGYTGEWGTDGRIAMLHQKELVLNAKDTENFLQATQILRTLQNNINEIQANVNSGLTPGVNVTAPAADLNQNVHIEANFPNVSNSHEIEEAFNNLVNMASQRAMSTRR